MEGKGGVGKGIKQVIWLGEWCGEEVHACTNGTKSYVISNCVR